MTGTSRGGVGRWEHRPDSVERRPAGRLGRRDRPFSGDLAEEIRLRERSRSAVWARGEGGVCVCVRARACTCVRACACL